MKKRHIIVKIMSLLLVGILVSGLIAPVCINTANEPEKQELSYIQEAKLSGSQAQENSGGQSAGKDDGTGKKSDGKTGEKSETVYVKAGADGSVSEIKVTEWLKNSKNGDVIEDFSILKDIKNVEGDEEFTVRPDGTLIWENHGANITYEGKTDKELPVSVKIYYYLDGKEISPEEIAGKTGNVRIRFEYENQTSEKVEVNGREVEAVVPFLMCTLLYLPSDIFSNVEVTNGKVMESEEQSIAVGYALPGLSDSLHLADYEPTEEIELPEYFEITAYAVDFELEFTATIAAAGLFDDLDTADLNDIDEMIDDMDELGDATGELEDGVGELLDGVREIKGYVNEYMAGVAAVDEGVGQLKDGVKTLKDQNENLKAGAAALHDGLSALNTMLGQVSIPGGAAGNDTAENDSDPAGSSMEAMSGAAAALMQDADALSSALEELKNSLSEMETFVSSAETYQTEVSGKTASAMAKLDGIDLAAVNDMAKSQAKAAVADALARSGLDTEKIAEIQTAADAGIDAADFTSGLAAQIDEVKNELNSMPVLNIPDTSIDTGSIFTVIDDMHKQLGILQSSAEYMTAAAEGLTELSSSLESLKTGVSRLEEGSKKLSEGVTAYTDGVRKVYEGVEALKDGTGKLSSVGGEFNEGFDALIEGVEKMRDGIAEFNEEGIKSLTDLAGEDLRRVIEAVRAAKVLNDGYNNFAGIKEGMEGSVLFIIETEGIEK